MGIRRALALTAIGLSGAGVLGVMLYPSRAAAFVRETTNYATGTPLAWSTGCIQMAVGDPRSSLLSWADLTTAVTGAADTWTQGSATCGGGFRLTVADAQRGALSVSHDG